MAKKKTRIKYDQKKDGDEFCISPEHYIRCCDCGLIHRVKVRKHKGKFYLKAWVDKRKTAQFRRRNAGMAAREVKY